MRVFVCVFVCLSARVFVVRVVCAGGTVEIERGEDAVRMKPYLIVYLIRDVAVFSCVRAMLYHD